jgi:hypothetical protein
MVDTQKVPQIEPIEELDVERFAREHPADHEKPPACSYRIRIDREHFVVEQPCLTGRELLRLVDKTPEEFMLSQKFRGGEVEKIEPDEKVDFRRPGVERFMTLPLDPTEGEAVPLRREFELPEADRRFLESLEYDWEAVGDGASRWLLLREYEPPVGYNHREVSVAIMIPPGYPDTPLDMFYFQPGLARADGAAIKALSTMTFCGGAWQRWSRHRTPQNPWRVGEDDLSSHLMLMRGLLERELARAN